MISGMKYWVLAGIMISGMTKNWVFGWRNAIWNEVLGVWLALWYLEWRTGCLAGVMISGMKYWVFDCH
jgi:hypothetical protein